MDERIMRDDRLVFSVADLDGIDLTIKITDANGVWLFNPNSLVWAFAEDGLRDKLSPIADKLSICSGTPGILYRSHDAELVLTPGEAYRMVMCALTPREYSTIREAVRETYFYWIVDALYNPDTGRARQPNIEVPVEITDANGVRSLDPDSLFDAFDEGLRDELSPMDDSPSLLSGAPGIRYRSSEAELVLTPDEVYRLVMRGLTPEEYFKIRAAVGEIFEIDDDVYDPETGEVRPDEEDDPDA